MTIGSFGVFFTLFLVFSRVFPTIAIAEIKATLPAPSNGSRLAADHSHHGEVHGSQHHHADSHGKTAEAH